MFFIRLMVLSLMCVLGIASLAQSKCNIPSQYWCDNDQIASDCGVLEQCNAMKRSTSAKPVEFSLYYESLCPDCKIFIWNTLTPAYEEIASIMDIHLIPYGNAQEKYDETKKAWVFTCQHGPQECLGNLIETCTINMYNISTYYPFINCIEMSFQQPKEAAIKCAPHFNVDIKAIMACATSAKGNALEHKMAQKTDALRPRHEYVPWVTVNGVHTEKIQQMAESDLIHLICTTYTGSPKPRGCNDYD